MTKEYTWDDLKFDEHPSKKYKHLWLCNLSFNLVRIAITQDKKTKEIGMSVWTIYKTIGCDMHYKDIIKDLDGINCELCMMIVNHFSKINELAKLGEENERN